MAVLSKTVGEKCLLIRQVDRVKQMINSSSSLSGYQSSCSSPEAAADCTTAHEKLVRLITINTMLKAPTATGWRPIDELLEPRKPLLVFGSALANYVTISIGKVWRFEEAFNLLRVVSRSGVFPIS